MHEGLDKGMIKKQKDSRVLGFKAFKSGLWFQAHALNLLSLEALDMSALGRGWALQGTVVCDRLIDPINERALSYIPES